MKKKTGFFGLTVILAFSFLIAVGCGMSTDQLGKEVREAIEEMRADQGIAVKIQEFTLVKRSKTEYKGILKVSADGQT